MARASPADLGVLLDVVGDLLRERFDADRLAVSEAVELCLPAGEVDELASVGDVTRAGDTDVVVGLVELLDGVALHQRGANLLVHREDDPVSCPNPDARRPALDGFTGVLDLVESPVW